MFFFLLLIDLSKAGYLAQLALRGSNPSEVTLNIAHGMELLGPAISLDTLVETLVIGVGTLSGVQRLEVLCGFAVMSVVVNYVVFMTFYPACLSLIMDLSRNGVELSKVKERAKDSLALHSFTEEDHKPNPVVQRVKVIMSTGLMLVHAYRYFICFSVFVMNIKKNICSWLILVALCSPIKTQYQPVVLYILISNILFR